MSELNINLNGFFFKENEPSILSNNRGFRYGDALFESIRMVHGNVQFLAEHLNRLITGMQVLKMEIPDNFNSDYFHGQIKQLIEKNQIKQDARIRLTVFRNEGGHYTPLSNKVSFLIEAEKLDTIGYVLNPKGFTIDIYSETKKPLNNLSSIKSANCLIYILAAQYKKQHQLDECIILNEKGNIAEVVSYNLFAVKNGVLYTPPINEGCVSGIMRQEVIKIARENKNAVYETTVALNVLLNADEIFLTNAIKGIAWVGAYRGKRYFNNTSKILIEKLNGKSKSGN